MILIYFYSIVYALETWFFSSFAGTCWCIVFSPRLLKWIVLQSLNSIQPLFSCVRKQVLVKISWLIFFWRVIYALLKRLLLILLVWMRTWLGWFHTNLRSFISSGIVVWISNFLRTLNFLNLLKFWSIYFRSAKKILLNVKLLKSLL